MKKSDKRILDAYRKSTIKSLKECYKDCSYAKTYAMINIVKNIKTSEEYSSLRIISYNTFMFTVGYITEFEDNKYLVYITPSKKRYILIDE